MEANRLRMRKAAHERAEPAEGGAGPILVVEPDGSGDLGVGIVAARAPPRPRTPARPRRGRPLCLEAHAPDQQPLHRRGRRGRSVGWNCGRPRGEFGWSRSPARTADGVSGCDALGLPPARCDAPRRPARQKSARPRLSRTNERAAGCRLAERSQRRDACPEPARSSLRATRAAAGARSSRRRTAACPRRGPGGWSAVRAVTATTDRRPQQPRSRRRWCRSGRGRTPEEPEPPLPFETGHDDLPRASCPGPRPRSRRSTRRPRGGPRVRFAAAGRRRPRAGRVGRGAHPDRRPHPPRPPRVEDRAHRARTTRRRSS